MTSHTKDVTVKYMLLLASNPADEPTPDSEAFGRYMGEWAAYSEALAEAGATVGGEALQGAETASTVRVRDGKRIVTEATVDGNATGIPPPSHPWIRAIIAGRTRHKNTRYPAICGGPTRL